MHAPVLRKVIISIILILALLIGGNILISIGHQFKEQPEQIDAPPQPVVVKAEKLQRQDFTEKIRAFGLARPIERANISSQVSGRILKVTSDIRVGDAVDEGQILAEIDPTTYEADVSRARALLAEAAGALQRVKAEIIENDKKREFVVEDIEIARSEVERAERLLKENVLSESARDQAKSALQAVQQRLSDIDRERAILEVSIIRNEATLEARKSELKAAEANLSYTKPKSPFPGVVEERFVDPGDYVQPGANLFTIVNTTELELPIEVPASQVRSVLTGAPVELITDEVPPRKMEGLVERISPTVNTGNRTASVYVKIDQGPEGQTIPPGTFMNASVSGRNFEQVFVIPRNAIVDDRIYIDRDGTAEELMPEFFVILDEVALTTDDLGEGAPLILSGFERLYDGAPVEVAPDSNEDVDSSVESPSIQVVSDEATPPAG